MPMKLQRIALRVSVAYGIFAGLWILLSDRALVALVSDPQTVSRLSIYKGWAFVAVTGFLLYGTLQTQLQRWQEEAAARIGAEKGLRESEERYRVAIESSNDGVTLIKGDEHIFVNRRFLDIFGYDTADEVMGKPLFMVIHPDDREMVAEYALWKKGGKPVPSGYEFRGITKDGAIKRIEASVAAVTYLGEPAGLAYLRDVTERKAGEEALRASRLQLAEAANLAKIAHWEQDGATREFVFNDSFYALYGTTAEYEGGYRMTRGEYGARFIHPDDRGEIRRQVAENRARPRRGDLEQYEHRGLRRDGGVIHILTRNRVIMDSDGRTIKVVGVNQDITARREMEDALRESETKLRAILDGSRDALAVTKDGIRTFVNPAYVSLFGYESAGELIGKPAIDVIAPESRDLIRDLVGRRASGQPAPSFYEVTGLKKDGTTFLMDTTISSYVLEGDRFILAVLRDVTEKRRLEEQLLQAQKMEAVGTLAGGVAHDFNNILTVIMGFGNLIQMSMGKDDVLRPHIDQIVTASERAADLTQSLLAFSRKQRIALEPHQLNRVVSSTAKLLARLLPEDMALTMNLADEDDLCLLDVTQIGQVLMNLATNARDAMPHGGSLTIATGRSRIDEGFRKTHGFGRIGEYVKLSVSDTGIGMDRQTTERIFEPFFTTKEVGKGTGLGLASAYGIVKQHNGYITVSSTPFKGTTFDIYLPLAGMPSQREVPTAKVTEGGAETVLIVEDDGNVRTMFARILESHGYKTMEAVDGDDAIRVHRAHREEIDLIILDVVMPGKNGKEALDEITATDPGAKAIFISGYTGDVVIDKGIESENVDFLHKPVLVTTLLAKVREVLDK